MKSIVVIGHKNPDTDSVIAALVCADFLKKVRKPILGFSNFKTKAARAGSLNKETKFVFNYFKQKPPPLIKNLKNKNVILGDDLSKDGDVKIYVLHCDEAGEILRKTKKAVE